MDKVLVMILGVFGAPDSTDCRDFNAHTYFIGCEHANRGGDGRTANVSRGSLSQPSGDKDKGHGNDPDGSDPDNPGSSHGSHGGYGDSKSHGKH